MPESNEEPATVASGKAAPIGGGTIFILVVSIVMCLVSAKIGLSAISWKRGEDWASLMYLVVGLPSLLLQVIFAPFLYTAFRRSGRGAAFASLIPLLLSVALAIAYFWDEYG